jgi:hypothetical protein
VRSFSDFSGNPVLKPKKCEESRDDKGGRIH